MIVLRPLGQGIHEQFFARIQNGLDFLIDSDDKMPSACVLGSLMLRFALVLLIALTSLVPQGLCTCRAICASLAPQNMMVHDGQDESDHCGCSSHEDASTVSDIHGDHGCEHGSPCGKKGEHHHNGCLSIIQLAEPVTISFTFDLALLHDVVGDLLIQSSDTHPPATSEHSSIVGSSPLFVLNCCYLI